MTGLKGNGKLVVPEHELDELVLEPVVDSSGWYSAQLRYAYLVGDAPIMVEDRVVLVDGDDEETALGNAIELAEEYEDEFETDAGESGLIRFEGIVALKELDDPPAAGTEVWHEFMAPDGVETGADGEPLPTVRPIEMAFPRARDD
ncbi:MAG: DUF4288 domain-containing protein [Chloroflexota bacterium]|nr:DUF4288 domain-containing protein [Chloroflexota bacterium]